MRVTPPATREERKEVSGLEQAARLWKTDGIDEKMLRTWVETCCRNRNVVWKVKQVCDFDIVRCVTMCALKDILDGRMRDTEWMDTQVGMGECKTRFYSSLSSTDPVIFPAYYMRNRKRS